MEGADRSASGELRSSDGRVLASTEPDRIGVADTAIVRSRSGADPEEIARAVVSTFVDWQITVDDRHVADTLIDLGEVLVRHAHLMALHLDEASGSNGDRAPGAPISVAALRPDPDRYDRLLISAYPVGHVDHDPAELLPGGARHTVAAYLSGEVVGPVRWDASYEACDGDEAVAFIVVSTTESGRVFPGGPWVTDVAVDPRYQGQGVGRALLTHAIAALVRAGDEQLGLAVSHGNRARELYARLGFVEIFESWRFMIAEV